MSFYSVNTNAGALIALQSLNAVNRELDEVRRRISTGLKISSARDNPAIWAIAQNQRSESRSLDIVRESLQRGQAVVDVAMTAGEQISDLLQQMRAKALAASEPGMNTHDRSLLNTDYLALRKQIDQVARLAEFNGINLISPGASGEVRALANTKGTSTIDVAHEDLSTSGAILSAIPADLTGTLSPAHLDTLAGAIDGVSAALARMGSGAKAMERHQQFVDKLQDTLEISISRLVDADLAKEAARLQALQVKQQLAIMALGIANRAPSLLLQLFGGRPAR